MTSGCGDAELDALLDSLGATDAPATDDAPATQQRSEAPATGDDGMDPDLAGLLKSRN